MICPQVAPGANDGFIAWKDAPEVFRPGGAPVIWGVPYQTGVMLFGSVGDLSYRVAAVNSAPSSEPEEWNYNRGERIHFSYVAHLGYQILDALRVGVSYNIGPYMRDVARPSLPAGSDLNDYDQEIWGLEVEFTRARWEVRGELFLDRWEVANVLDDPKDRSWYLEVKRKLLPGLYGAVRYNAIEFNKIRRTGGGKERWDYDVESWQLGLGYRISPNTEVRTELQHHSPDGPGNLADDLVVLQLTWHL